MSVRRPKSGGKPKVAPGKGVAAWGWYGLLSVLGKGTFWCAWWSEDPRRNRDAPPDDFGFVDGWLGMGEAVGAAYDSLRKARGSAKAFRDLHTAYEAALAAAKRREETSARADIAAGKAPPREARKPRRQPAAAQSAL